MPTARAIFAGVALKETSRMDISNIHTVFPAGRQACFAPCVRGRVQHLSAGADAEPPAAVAILRGRLFDTFRGAS
jgi:hypothetical protein